MDLVKGLAASMNDPDAADNGKNAAAQHGKVGMGPSSPMARVAHRTMLARKAAAKLHARAERYTKRKPQHRAPPPDLNIKRPLPLQPAIGPQHTGLQMLPTDAGPSSAVVKPGIDTTSASSSSTTALEHAHSRTSSRRVTSPAVPGSARKDGVVNEKTKKLPRRSESEGDILKKEKDKKKHATSKLKSQRSKRYQHASKKRYGVLSSLFTRDDAAHDGRRLSIGYYDDNHSHGCFGYIVHCCSHFMNGGSVKWHDKRYGRVGRKAQAMQWSHCILLIILIWFDIQKKRYDVTESPHVQQLANLFYVPSGISFLLFSKID